MSADSPFIDGATIERTPEHPILVSQSFYNELQKIVEDMHKPTFAETHAHNYTKRLESLERLERSYTSTRAMRKAKKRERLNRAKGRRHK